MRVRTLFAVGVFCWVGAVGWELVPRAPVLHGTASPIGTLDTELAGVLLAAGFTGTIETTLPERLGRQIDPGLADLGRLLFFDNVLGLHEDNSCAGCHTPAFGFGDSQSIAIGVQSNRIVGPDRVGPRNQRKAPQIVNSAFLPKLMLNGRFLALSDDPFDNSLGFQFPLPEGITRFPPADARFPSLLAAQGHIPQTELVEMAGFTGATTNSIFDPKFHQFDDGLGTTLPHDTDGDGFLNEEIRTVVLGKIKQTDGYVRRFRQVFGISNAKQITFDMIGRALSEFQTSLTFTDAPVDRFARGDWGAMGEEQKRGALLFFGKAGCVTCHGVSGRSNEMFSDFENHVLGVPQLAPFFGVGAGNVVFDGPNQDEDFGAEQITGDPNDRYKFRTSPLRNAIVQPAFFHNGAFSRLEDAIRHHLHVQQSAKTYDAVAAGVDADLTMRRGPLQPVLARLDEAIRQPIALSPTEFTDLVAFVRDGLLDPRATPAQLCSLVPSTVPSGLPVLVFQGCQ